MKQIFVLVLAVVAMTATSCVKENDITYDMVSQELSVPNVEKSDSVLMHEWCEQLIFEDCEFGNYIPLISAHPELLERFSNGTATYDDLMHIGWWYFYQDIYGDTTGEGEWSKQEQLLMDYFKN